MFSDKFKNIIKQATSDQSVQSKEKTTEKTTEKNNVSVFPKSLNSTEIFGNNFFENIISESIKQNQKTQKEEEDSQTASKNQDSFVDNPPTVKSTTHFSSINSRDDFSLEQYSALKKYENNKDAYYDIFDSGYVVVSFSDGRNSVKIDQYGNETELETTVKKHPTGKKAISYTLTDEEGNTYTKSIRYDEADKLTDTNSEIKNKNGQTIIYENLSKLGTLKKRYEYEYDENGNKSKEIKSEYNTNGKIKSTEEYHYEYDENGNKNKETVINYDKNGKIKSTEESHYEYDENGNKNKETVLTYDKNGDIKSTKESRYEYDENGKKNKGTVSTYDKNGDIKSTKEYQYENGNIVGNIETLFDSENGKIIINEQGEYGIIQKKTISKQDAETGNTIKTTLEYDNEKNVTNWSQEIINEEGEIVSELNQEKLIAELDKNGKNISENFAKNIGQYCNDLMLDDIIYIFSNGYDKYFENIADYGGIERILDGNATSFVTNDYNKLINTIKNRESVEEAFCPSMDSEENAAEKLNLGDTCVIDNKLYIKTDSGMEQLNMSREKYLELFPPSARFSINQQKSGDCYLLSAMYSIQTNPHTYANILRCFTENEDGSVTVKIPFQQINEKYSDPDIPISEYLEYQKRDDFYYTSDITLTIPANKKMDDFYTPDINYKGEYGKTYAKACEGIRALEYLYGFNILNENIDNVFKELDAAIESGNQKEIDRLNDKIKEVAYEAELKKGSGGKSNYVFFDFGLEPISTENLENENYIYVASTSSETNLAPLDNIGASDNHAYAMRPFYDENGEVKYEIANPWHTSYSIILTYDELMDSFDQFYIGKL